jgi:hypothetical protein
MGVLWQFSLWPWLSAAWAFGSGLFCVDCFEVLAHRAEKIAVYGDAILLCGVFSAWFWSMSLGIQV